MYTYTQTIISYIRTNIYTHTHRVHAHLQRQNHSPLPSRLIMSNSQHHPHRRPVPKNFTIIYIAAHEVDAVNTTFPPHTGYLPIRGVYPVYEINTTVYVPALLEKKKKKNTQSHAHTKLVQLVPPPPPIADSMTASARGV